MKTIAKKYSNYLHTLIETKELKENPYDLAFEEYKESISNIEAIEIKEKQYMVTIFDDLSYSISSSTFCYSSTKEAMAHILISSLLQDIENGNNS